MYTLSQKSTKLFIKNIPKKLKNKQKKLSLNTFTPNFKLSHPLTLNPNPTPRLGGLSNGSIVNKYKKKEKVQKRGLFMYSFFNKKFKDEVTKSNVNFYFLRHNALMSHNELIFVDPLSNRTLRGYQKKVLRNATEEWEYVPAVRNAFGLLSVGVLFAMQTMFFVTAPMALTSGHANWKHYYNKKDYPYLF